MIAALTGMGLSAAAGLNAYIPFLVVALIARFTDFITLPQSYSWIESWWAIGIGAVLLLTEVVLDKIPADRHRQRRGADLHPAQHGRPGLRRHVRRRGPRQLDLDDQNPWVGVVLGIIVSGLVHGGKTVARPAINAGTLGFGAPVASTVEDGASIGLSLVAVFIPVLVILFLVLLAWLLVWLWLKVRRWRKRRDRRAALA